MNIKNLTNDNRKCIKKIENFFVIEHQKDLSVSENNAQQEYFMSAMNVKRRQLLIQMNGNTSATLQAGAMQWTLGNIETGTGIKGAKDLLGKFGKGIVTKESAIKPEYHGTGFLMLEPTYKHILLVDLKEWPGGMAVEDGMFLACESNTKLEVQMRKNISSAVLGNEGLFNLKLVGNGIAALESFVPEVELMEVMLNNETLKIDGDLAVAWSSTLDFTVEKSSKSLLGSAVNKEGLVNVYRGTGKVLMSPVANTNPLQQLLNE